MARYVDVDKAIERIRNGDGTPMQKLFAECCLLTVPAADVAPKNEVAREIFEEIEKLSYRFMNDKHYIFGDMIWDIAELKKKYTEEK